MIVTGAQSSGVTKLFQAINESDAMKKTAPNAAQAKDSIAWNTSQSPPPSSR